MGRDTRYQTGPARGKAARAPRKATTYPLQFYQGWIAARAAHWPTKENRRKTTIFVFVRPMEQLVKNGPDNYQEVLFLVIKTLQAFWACPFPFRESFVDFQIPRFADAAAG